MSEDFVCAATLLGIDSDRNPEYAWIVQKALDTRLDPNEWVEVSNDDSPVGYYNTKSGRITATHPVISLYSRAYQILHAHDSHQFLIGFERDFTELAKVLALVDGVIASYARADATAYQKTMSSVLGFLGLGKTCDSLIHVSLEKTINHYLTNNSDISKILPHLIAPFQELERHFMSQESQSFDSKSSIRLCSECESISALLRCDQCHDDFCHSCHKNIHSRGNLRSHTSTEIAQLACLSCDQSFASFYCLDCGLFYCEICFSKVHAVRPKFLKHRKRNIVGLICHECEEEQSTLLCQNCHDLFCSDCYTSFHQKGNRQKHTTLSIDLAGNLYRDGIVLNHRETVAEYAQVEINSMRESSITE